MEASWAFVLHCAAAAIVFLLTLGSTVQTILRIIRKPERVPQDKLYEDEDGVASEESQKAYSIKLQNILATFITVAGFGVSLAGAIRATVEVTNEQFVNEWLQLSLWVCATSSWRTMMGFTYYFNRFCS